MLRSLIISTCCILHFFSFTLLNKKNKLCLQKLFSEFAESQDFICALAFPLYSQSGDPAEILVVRVSVEGRGQELSLEFVV